MQTKKDKLDVIIRWSSIVLMLVIIVLQFLPFWNIDGKSISVASYVWWPEKNAELTTFMRTELGNPQFDVRNILNQAFFQLVSAGFGIFWYLTKKDSPMIAVVPFICAILGITAYLFNPPYRYGGNWILQLVINVVLLALAVIKLVKVFKNLTIITK